MPDGVKGGSTKRTQSTARATANSPADASLAGLSKAVLDKLAKLNIASKFDLVLHLPLRYDDETQLYPIKDAPTGRDVLIEATVVECDIKYRPRRQLVCHLEDGSGVVTLRFFSFYGSQVKHFAAGARVRAFGEIRHGFFGAEMVHPRYRIVQGETPVAEALTPVYPTTAGMGQDTLRKLIVRALASEKLDDTLPDALIRQHALPKFRDAVYFLHNPSPDVVQQDLQLRAHPAWRRMKFDELLAQQLSMRVHQQRRRGVGAPALRPRGTLVSRLLKDLPFKLTGAQQRAVAQLREDLSKPHPMQRLLQGDVGSGKTVVAAMAALQCVENKYQVALMAPTEILAEQHYRKFSAWLAPLGINIAWLSGGIKKTVKKQILTRIAAGDIPIVVGTHALFEDDVVFNNLGLAIIDEQHRFGVRQRLALRLKGTHAGDTVNANKPEASAQPHQLMMSATPIPRTLAMSYYADLDVSVIDELPPGRTPVTTKLVSDARRDEVIARVREACAAGSQAYWVCPLVEEIEAGEAPDDKKPKKPHKPGRAARVGMEALQLKAAMETYETLSAAFPDLKVGLAHGRLKGEEKSAVMGAFQRGEVQLLVATTVIEVGVDVPNASLMVIENAERMGLSQLHQLRGRVGRGAAQSACILLYRTPLSPMARERLKIIFENTDGFEVARHDLRMRGPGELLGARQSGVPLLRFADLTTDVDLLDAARD
ncbi:MAG TPA: ATP-dependent DNA helicase RecG, partial [Burkholderiales bacterium]|nr:ATP-dependent DNA helicase RecG [Burkholderiales bacterium]